MGSSEVIAGAVVGLVTAIVVEVAIHADYVSAHRELIGEDTTFEINKVLSSRRALYALIDSEAAALRVKGQNIGLYDPEPVFFDDYLRSIRLAVADPSSEEGGES